MQKICVRCHKKLGFLDKMECKDGTFCFKCTENLNKKVRYNLEKYSTDEIIDRIEHPEKYEEENAPEVCFRCKAKLGIINRYECKDGLLCNVCIKKLTKKVQKNLKEYSVEQIADMIEHPEQYEEQYAQVRCVRCKAPLGFLDKSKCRDGVFCYDCIKGLHKKIRYNLELYSVEQITDMIESPEKYSEKDLVPQKFHFANRIVTFDPVNQEFFTETAGFFRSESVSYSSILSYEYKEDGKTKGTYGKMLGMAAVGGILFGGAGAIVGAMMKGKGEKHLVKRIEIVVNYQGEKEPEVFRMKVLDPVLHTDAVRSDSSEYRHLLESAQAVMQVLDRIIEDNHPEVSEQPINVQAPPLSAADEIRKFKELMDEGIITKEEFEVKKKELLG